MSQDLFVESKGEGFPVLCLHGHPGTSGCLSVFTDRLSQQFWTLAPDLRGYGRSQVREEFELTDHLADLEALLERLGIDSFLLLGWSLGGILALELALRHPQRVKGLILIATAARPRGNHPPVNWRDYLYTGIAALLNGIKPGWEWNIEQFGRRSLFRTLIRQHTPQAYRYLAQEGTRAYLSTSQAAHQALNRALRERYDRRDALAQIKCPALVLAGSHDCHITADSSWETAQALSKSQWRCYPQTAHLFPWEVPNLVLADIDHWLDSQAW
ncbi:alpha/beta hydrolase [Roseofilum reptotaenium CS-1145]|uniref:Alpha/beta hydrolase n=1 Tax=Roseofilum reptotaenium AO1-A TaxID=1925591 RepID=A0A1L9QV13_9CYAN|nr:MULTISPECIES: alpha/beta hydrolase [Roseofilum]MBP0028813.1 alpha/beta hydrolase [Roseofilum sp. Guam]MDB9518726.1 alpha/beta hydrolase [Roseofilum reptotaenium CS-1145]OJJ26521.1 alpha/beta hydrolase [Roseofilum reptotaenium AO1-A]